MFPERTNWFFASERTSRRNATIAGTFAVVAIASLQLGFQKGSSGPFSVVASQFATVAVILSVLFNRERMRWWQAIGVASTAVAVALIAAVALRNYERSVDCINRTFEVLSSKRL